MWPVVALGDIFEIARGGSPRPIDDYITEDADGLNWVMISDASASGKVIYRTKKRIKPEGLKKTRQVAPGDFILSNSMSFGRPYIMGTSGCIHDGWLLMRPKTPQFDADYFYHLLGSPDVYQSFASRAAGATVKNLNSEIVREVEIPLPPLEEQKRIAAILDQADALRRLRARALDRLNALGQAIFHEMFGDPAVDEERWPSRPLADFAREQDDIKCGPFGTQLLKSEFCEEGVPLWGIKQVNKHFQIPTHEYVTAEKAKELAQYSILPKDIIMTRKGTIGNCAVYPDSFAKGLMHSDLLRLRIDPERHNAVFVAAQLRYNRSFILQLELISGGAIMAGINVGRLKSLHAIAPPKALQDEYADRVACADEALATLRLSARNSETLFTSLQHRAFRGEL